MNKLRTMKEVHDYDFITKEIEFILDYNYKDETTKSRIFSNIKININDLETQVLNYDDKEIENENNLHIKNEKSNIKESNLNDMTISTNKMKNLTIKNLELLKNIRNHNINYIKNEIKKSISYYESLKSGLSLSSSSSIDYPTLSEYLNLKYNQTKPIIEKQNENIFYNLLPSCNLLENIESKSSDKESNDDYCKRHTVSTEIDELTILLPNNNFYKGKNQIMQILTTSSNNSAFIIYRSIINYIFPSSIEELKKNMENEIGVVLNRLISSVIYTDSFNFSKNEKVFIINQSFFKENIFEDYVYLYLEDRNFYNGFEIRDFNKLIKFIEMECDSYSDNDSDRTVLYNLKNNLINLNFNSQSNVTSNVNSNSNSNTNLKIIINKAICRFITHYLLNSVKVIDVDSKYDFIIKIFYLEEELAKDPSALLILDMPNLIFENFNYDQACYKDFKNTLKFVHENKLHYFGYDKKKNFNLKSKNVKYNEYFETINKVIKSLFLVVSSYNSIHLSDIEPISAIDDDQYKSRNSNKNNKIDINNNSNIINEKRENSDLKRKIGEMLETILKLLYKRKLSLTQFESLIFKLYSSIINSKELPIFMKNNLNEIIKRIKSLNFTTKIHKFDILTLIAERIIFIYQQKFNLNIVSINYDFSYINDFEKYMAALTTKRMNRFVKNNIINSFQTFKINNLDDDLKSYDNVEYAEFLYNKSEKLNFNCIRIIEPFVVNIKEYMNNIIKSKEDLPLVEFMLNSSKLLLVVTPLFPKDFDNIYNEKITEILSYHYNHYFKSDKIHKIDGEDLDESIHFEIKEKGNVDEKNDNLENFNDLNNLHENKNKVNDKLLKVELLRKVSLDMINCFGINQNLIVNKYNLD